ncbi:hypothetical protein O181_079966 [Austropuccinia psidii MF-1]|uniref:Uncharacterized protein n=1 Tax=Austropuccinia psidii MF-1 TaxID=1389203 RepID=A0A9Q3IEH3_9BASI|nr:hypothetical protein [Austropuccinia psidii MF-1]
MSHTLTNHSIQNFQLCHHLVGRGISPYAPTPAQAHEYTPAPAWAHAYAHTPAHAHANTNAPANATARHPRYCAVGSTSVIRKMTILRSQSPFMDDLVRSNPPPLHQDCLKDLFDVCVWKQACLV